MLSAPVPLPRSMECLSRTAASSPGPIAVRDTAHAYEISADLCGAPEGGVMIHVSGRVLTIMGDSPDTLTDDDEFAPDALKHVVLMPAGLDVAHTSIRCAQGRVSSAFHAYREPQ